MIKIPNSLLSKPFFSPRIISFFWTLLWVGEGILFYIILPVYFGHSLNVNLIFILTVFYLVTIIIFLLIFGQYLNQKNRLLLLIEEQQEKINLLATQNAQELKIQFALREKINRYAELKEILEKINQTLSLDEITDTIINTCFNLVGDNSGVALLFLVDPSTHRLKLFKSLKSDSRLIIKTKEGDIFDQWAMRHVSPLLVEDAKKDFRFDYEKLAKYESRPICSLISSPFLAENKFLGLIRLEHAEKNAFNQDDLRFLVAISDLGAVAIEGSQLYQKTLELATHDSLTNLYTKGYFLQLLNQEFIRNASKRKPFSIIMIDIDFFKKYNDSLGHSAGDMVLKNLGQALQRVFPQPDNLVCRFGGEEFCILLINCDKKTAQKKAEEFRILVEGTRLMLRRQESQVTLSLGVAGFPEDGTTAEQIIMKSDSALYQAKREGRNRVAIC